jgi:aryl-alcohol dehydrogenase-like predicted oxidoreductase
MDYRRLGRSGLKVSPLCLGTMMFGGQADEAKSGRIIGKAREVGVNFIDTADVYNAGESEAVVGRALAGPRTEAQWDDYLAAMDYTFTAEDEALIDRLASAGHPSTPGYTDPAYPIEGRPTRVAAA